MGNVIKHRGATKSHGKLAVCDCYDDEELRDDDHSRDEELRVDDHSRDEEPKEGEMNVGDLTCGNGTHIH